MTKPRKIGLLQQIADVNEQVTECTSCNFCKVTTNKVYIDLLSPSTLMFVVDYPDTTDDICGRPLSNSRLRLKLKNVIEEAFSTYPVPSYCIVSLMNCTPYYPSRNNIMIPTSKQIKFCAEKNFRAYYNTVNPKHLIALGKRASGVLHSMKFEFTSIHYPITLVKDSLEYRRSILTLQQLVI